MNDTECACNCHGQSAMNRLCSIEGGCGHLHRNPEPDDSHRCARNRRCADRKKITGDDGEKHWAGYPIPTARGLCESCYRNLAQSVPHLIGDYVELTTILGVTGAGSDDQIRFSRELPIPIRLAVKTLQEQIVTEVEIWVEPVSEALGIDWLSTTQQAMSRPQFRVHRAVNLLVHALPTLLAVPPQEVSAWDRDGLPTWDDVFDCQDVTHLDGVDGAMRMLRLHELTKIVAGRGELTHKLAAPCPRCDRLTLVRDNGTSDVHCQACKDRWPEADYQRLCLVLASDEHRRIRICDQCDKNGRLPNRKICTHLVGAVA